MDSDKIEKYLQTYIDDVIVPKINNELVGEKTNNFFNEFDYTIDCKGKD